MLWRRTPPEPLAPDQSTVEAIIDANVGIAVRFGADLRDRLLAHVDELLRTKRWEATAGTVLTDEMLVTIAANAAIPVLAFDLWPYRQVKSIIIRPSATVSTGVRSGPVAGTFSDHPVGIIGEASPNSGPVSLSWDAALGDSRRPRFASNVVIHEFAHKIDMNDGFADGVPPLRGAALANWQHVLDDEFHRTEARDSDAVLRPYAWSSPAEFFAVATETFFCVPAQLAEAKPALYSALSDLYQQSPALDWLPEPV